MKIELSKGRRLQPGPAGVVVMATCQGLIGKPNIITFVSKTCSIYTARASE